tara:strand:+ start:774 stop:977 length:204 start_codon:yes stop_codon:yes gene_type:complete
MTSYEVEVKQTLYWTVGIKVETDHEIEDLIHDAETSRLSELENHYSFADYEEREAKVLTMNGEKYEF